MSQAEDIRLSLPSKGRLAEPALELLEACGLKVEKPNPRQYAAHIPTLPALTVLFQRPGDIVVSVRDGSVEFGITGMDVVAERRGANGQVVVLHNELGFGQCRLSLAVPESWQEVENPTDLVAQARKLGRALRVATQFPVLTSRYLEKYGVSFALIQAEGTLEVAPTIGYADCIADLVSSGQTLRDNRLRELRGAPILISEAALIANRSALQSQPESLKVARVLLEYVEAHLRAVGHVGVFANMRGTSPQEIAERMFGLKTLGGLQGPTFSQVVVPSGDPNWYAVHIIVRRQQLFDAVQELRSIGGSGVVVTPVDYIFEEEPARYRAMLDVLEKEHRA